MIAVIQKKAVAGNWHRGPEPPRGVTAVSIHVAVGTEQSVDSWFANPSADVSAHFLIGFDGELRQYVGIHDIANAQGIVDRPTWKGLRGSNPNAYLVSIEHEGNGTAPWPEAQLLTSTLLAGWLFQRFKLEPVPINLPLHSEIRAAKPFCPGPHFHRDDYLDRVRWWLRYHDPKSLITGIR